MSEVLDLSSSGILIGDGSNRARDLSSIYQPSENQIFILDTDFKSADQKFLFRLPISFQIDYRSNRIANPPDLFLLVNPSNLNVSNNKKINSEFSRGGYITEEWGGYQETLEFSGKIGAYYVWNPSKDFSGLNRYDRTKSPSFRNLMNLIMIFRNNGMVFDDTPLNPIPNKSDNLIQNKNLFKKSKRISQIARSKKNRIIDVGDVYLNYDGTSYRGSFDSFSIEEKADEPYTLSYSFSFTVRDKFVSDKRSIQNISKGNISLDDKDKNSPSTKEIRELEKVSRNSINSSQEILPDERARLSSEKASLLNPQHATPIEDILKGDVVKVTAGDHVRFLASKGNNLDNSDILKLEKNISDMNSREYNTSSKGYSESITTHEDIISKNTSNNPSSSKSAEAVNLSQELFRNLQEKNKLANK